MDAEQSGEVVEGADFPQQQTEIQKDVASRAETSAEMETPAAPAANGESEHVNGHSEVGSEREEEDDDAKTEENVPQEDPKEEPVPSVSAKDGMEADAGKEAENDQPEREEKPAEAPVNEPAPEPAVAPEPVETPPPKEEEKAVENVEAQKEKEQEQTGETGTTKEEDDKMVDGDKAAGDEETKKSDEAKEEVKEKSVAVEAEGAPTAAATAAAEVKEQEEEPTPAPGSLAFAILEHGKTKDAFAATRTLVVLRGLPGSGKSFLARAIADSYKDVCSVVCADGHDAKAFDEAIAAKCGAGASPALVVVDDSNHTQDRLAHLRGVAKQHRLVAVFLEPRTEWRRDAAQLAKKTKRGLEQAKLEAMKKLHEEMSLPLYFGWFLFFTGQDKVKETSTNFLKALEAMESFKKHTSDFRGKEEKEEGELDLQQYFKAKGTLHCTAKFTNYGKAEGAKEYAEKQVVQDLYGSVSELSLTGLFVTPRTVGARVSLSDDQLQLWPDDGEKEADAAVPGAAALPRGSRAHVTLGCADGVQPVQTGYDLLQILLLQKDGQQGEQAEIDPGTLTYYGEGRWYLSLKEPISTAACFSSTYKPKAPGPVKKEKKKAKCAIL